LSGFDLIVMPWPHYMANSFRESENLLYSNLHVHSAKMPPTKHILSWDTGSVPRSLLFDDTFFSCADGRAETAYVFVDGNRLSHRWRGPDQFAIAELGFGTGLNFLETWRRWIGERSPSQQLLFTSFEAYPIAADDMERALAPWQTLKPLRDDLLQRWQQLPSSPVRWKMDEQTMLEVVHGKAEQAVANWNGLANAWYLDGFSPARNPDMWSRALMQQVFDHTATGGSFATYTAAGRVRRNLQAAGFSVSKRKGFAGKREMMLGRK